MKQMSNRFEGYDVHFAINGFASMYDTQDENDAVDAFNEIYGNNPEKLLELGELEITDVVKFDENHIEAPTKLPTSIKPKSEPKACKVCGDALVVTNLDTARGGIVKQMLCTTCGYSLSSFYTFSHMIKEEVGK